MMVLKDVPKEVHREMFSNKMISRKKEQMKPWENEELHLCCNKVWTILWPKISASLASINAHLLALIKFNKYFDLYLK
jgi:hypothetical protein